MVRSSIPYLFIHEGVWFLRHPLLQTGLISLCRGVHVSCGGNRGRSTCPLPDGTHAAHQHYRRREMSGCHASGGGWHVRGHRGDWSAGWRRGGRGKIRSCGCGGGHRLGHRWGLSDWRHHIHRTLRFGRDQRCYGLDYWWRISGGGRDQC